MATSVAGRPAQTGIRSPETITVYDGDGHTMAEGISGVDVQAPMIGREKELRFLEDHLDTAAKGKGSLVLVSGEAGIGKTRLVEELKSVASARGFLVLRSVDLAFRLPQPLHRIQPVHRLRLPSRQDGLVTSCIFRGSRAAILSWNGGARFCVSIGKGARRHRIVG